MMQFFLLLATILIYGAYVDKIAFKRGYEEAKFDEYKANMKLRRCLMQIGEKT